MERVAWLKEFEYEGQMVYQDMWEMDQGGWRRLKGLGEVVRRRADTANGDGGEAEERNLPDVAFGGRRRPDLGPRACSLGFD